MRHLGMAFCEQRSETAKLAAAVNSNLKELGYAR
jgi:hypothetical protein